VAVNITSPITEGKLQGSNLQSTDYTITAPESRSASIPQTQGRLKMRDSARRGTRTRTANQY
uniref:Uncharacterized protein n=1 Tax=Aegilops tauschii subsp. strangulata TaxID=200361 RepID=A0A453ADI8_AEGTS